MECTLCGQTFLMLSDAACGRCKKLEGHERSSDTYRQIMSWPQCVACGACFQHMPLPGNGVQLCGKPGCKDGVAPTPSQFTAGTNSIAPSIHINNSLSNNALLRSEEFRNRIRARSRPEVVVATTRLSSAALHERENALRQEIANASTSMRTQVTIVYAFRLSTNCKQEDGTLGSGEIAFDGDKTLSDVHAYLVHRLNDEWHKRKKFKAFYMEETDLRRGKNKHIPDGWMTRTLEAYKSFCATQNWLVPLAGPSIRRPRGGGTLAMGVPVDLFLDMEMYYDRLEREGCAHILDQMGVNSGSSAKKRPRAGTSSNLGLSSKIPRYSCAPVSVFSGAHTSFSTKKLVTRTKVEVQKIICKVLNNQGDPAFEKKEKLDLYISDMYLASGTMKLVFDAAIPDHDSPIVVKRFFKIENSSQADLDGSGTPPKVDFDVLTHNSLIRAEGVRAGLGQRLLTSFYRDAEQADVNVYKYFFFDVPTFYQEISKPSPASGVSDEPFVEEEAEENFILWCGERKHPSQVVIRFNGTLSHPSSRVDIKHLTIYAFCHYVYGVTKGTLVFADIQGTPATFKDGNRDRDGYLLFDVMTHTDDKGSGIGDFGKEGIEKFVEDHVCHEVCLLLGLDKQFPLSPVASEERDCDSENEGNTSTEGT